MTSNLDNTNSISLSLPRRMERVWRFWLLRGIAAVLIGGVTFIWIAMEWLGFYLVGLVFTIIYGAYAFADGIFALGAAIKREQGHAPIWWLAIVGLLNTALGLFTFAFPGVVAIFMPYPVGLWAFARGFIEILGGIRLRKEIPNEWLLILSGALSVNFALVILNDVIAAKHTLTLIGAYSVALGFLYLALALRLKPLKASEI